MRQTSVTKDKYSLYKMWKVNNKITITICISFNSRLALNFQINVFIWNTWQKTSTCYLNPASSRIANYIHTNISKIIYDAAIMTERHSTKGTLINQKDLSLKISQFSSSMSWTNETVPAQHYRLCSSPRKLGWSDSLQ